ncbi:MAG: DUF3795 domain-containing protein [bacterium]
MKERQYGPCGLFCSACGASDCDGCRSECVDDLVRQCKFRNCSKDRNVDFCCFCGDYPCEGLRAFMNDKWPHHRTMEPNLQYIKNNGLKKWLQTQQQEWSCIRCGSPIVWYQKHCSCGQKLESFEIPKG